MTFWFGIIIIWTVWWIQISLIPTLCTLNKNWWFLHFLKEFWNFSFGICELVINIYLINEILLKRKIQNIVQHRTLISQLSRARISTINPAIHPCNPQWFSQNEMGNALIDTGRIHRFLQRSLEEPDKILPLMCPRNLSSIKFNLPFHSYRSQHHRHL